MYSRAGLSQDTPLYPPNMKLPTWIMVTVGPLSSQLPWNVDAAQPSSLACQHLTNLLRTELLITGSKNDLKFSKYLMSLPRIVDASKPPLKKKRHLWFLSVVLAPAALSGTQRSCTRIVMPKVYETLFGRSRDDRGYWWNNDLRVKDPVHTYPDIFESATLFAHLASFHTYPVNHLLFSNVTRSSPVRYREYSRRCPAQCHTLLYFLYFSFKSYNVCVVKPCYHYCKLQ